MAALLNRPNLESRCSLLSAGDEEVLRLMLQAGADEKAWTLCEPGTGESDLHIAVSRWRKSMLSLLIRYVADVNASGMNLAGQTALHIAAKHGSEDALRELIRASANVFARYADGRTALHVAAAEGRVNTASILLNHGLDMMTEYGSKVTPVIMAAIHSRNKMLRFLLDRCVGSMSEESKIRTAIGAAGTGRLDNLKMFDNDGFPILGRNDLGESGLSLSAYCGYKDVVVYFLQRGADPRQRSYLNTTAFDMAIHRGRDDIVELLQDAERQRAADPNAELSPEWKNCNKSSPSRQAETMAGIMSLHATGTIHENQEPAGIFSCGVCKDLDFQRGMPHDAEVAYFMCIAPMSSASRGCRGCQFLSDCLTQFKNVYGEGLWGNQPMADLALNYMALGGSLLLSPVNLISPNYLGGLKYM